MRRNAQRLIEFRNDLVTEIKDWFIAKPIAQIEFKRMFTVQVDVANTFNDSDWGIECVVVNFLTDDGFVIDNEGGEIELTELNCAELAFILDELEEGNFNITSEKEM